MKPQLPSELLACPERPEVPFGMYTQKDVAEYIIGLAEAHAECRSKLHRLGTILDTYEALTPEPTE